MKKQLLMIAGCMMITGSTFAQMNATALKLNANSVNPKVQDITGTPLHKLSYNWNVSVFDTATLNTYTYDVNNRQVLDISQDYNNHQFDYTQKGYTYYNSSNATENPDSAVTYGWQGNTWVRQFKVMYTYQNLAMGYPSSLDMYVGSIHYISVKYTYDNNNHISKVVFSTFQTSGPKIGQLMATDSSNFTTDGSGNVLTQDSYKWSNFHNMYIKNGYSTSTYDGNNNMLTQVEQNWDTIGNALVNDERTTNTYNSYNNPTVTVYESWNTGSSAYENVQRTTTNYKNNTELDFELVESWDGTTYVNTNKYVWDNTPLSVSNLASFANVFSVFPNPGSGSTNILFTQNTTQPVKVSVLDANGKQVMVVRDEIMNSGLHSLNVNTTDLAKGLYFIQMQNGSKTTTQKLIIQ